MKDLKAIIVNPEERILLPLDINYERNQNIEVSQTGLIVKCGDCAKLTIKNSDFYCTRLKHPLESGYAMTCHSKFCGGPVSKP